MKKKKKTQVKMSLKVLTVNALESREAPGLGGGIGEVDTETGVLDTTDTVNCQDPKVAFYVVNRSGLSLGG